MTKRSVPQRGVTGKERVDTACSLEIAMSPDDGEPRVSDEALAIRLGYSSADAFRKVIRKHQKMLRKINHLSRVDVMVERPQGGGRGASRYLLTEAQAIFLIGKAGTCDADDVFAEIARAFVEFRRTHFRDDRYGSIIKDLLLPAPRTWEQEYPESFWQALHKVGGWARSGRNNHSNCAHFINKFIYEHLLGELGLEALRDLNPANDDGERAYRHHQFLKTKCLDKLRSHIDTVERLLQESVSIRHFADRFALWFRVPNAQIGMLFQEEMPGRAA